MTDPDSGMGGRNYWELGSLTTVHPVGTAVPRGMQTRWRWLSRTTVVSLAQPA
jgi:hypothetical protein